MKAVKIIGHILLILVKVSAILFLVIIFYFLIPPFYNRYIVYPKMEHERTALWKKYKKPQQFISDTDFKGVLHAHTYRSHDSRGILAEIIPAAKKAKLNFIFLADHRMSDLDTFPRGIHGTFNDIVIESGTESPGASMMVTPLRKVVLDWKSDRRKLIHDVVKKGGMVFYLHSEDSHDWANPDYQGMEIYNIHSDLIDEKDPLKFLINGMFNSGVHRHWSYRALFDEQTKIVALWDSLNNHRKIVGMAAVDAHNNQSLRARYLKNGKVEWVGPNAKTLSVTEPGWKEKLLLGKPDVAGWAFKIELDTYFHSFNFANTHIFGDTLTSRFLKNELAKGHAYISFESLAEANGFQFVSADSSGKINAIMGDSVENENVLILKATSPFPVRFELFKNGKLIDSKDDRYDYEFYPKNKKGNYRIVGKLKFNKEWLPWVYTNPIYIY